MYITKKHIFACAYKLFLSCCWTPVCSSCHGAINHPTLGTAISLVHQAVAAAAKWSAGATPPHNTGASSIIFIVIWVSDQRTTIPSGIWGYFPVATEVQWNSRMIFPGAVRFQCWPCDCFPSTGRYRGTRTWVALKLQSIMCDCGNVTNTYSGQHTHTVQAHTYRMCTESRRCTHTPTVHAMCTSTCSLCLLLLPWMHSDTQQARSDGKRNAVRFSGFKTHCHICNPSIWECTDYYCLSWASADMLWRTEKKGVKQITLEEPSCARTEIYLNWRGTLVVVPLHFMLKFT